MYNKIKIGTTIFDIIRQDFKKNDLMMDMYILAEIPILTIEQLVQEANGKFEYLDINGIVKEIFKEYIYLDDISKVGTLRELYNIDDLDNRDVIKISVRKEDPEKNIALNTANIEYIAAMSDIDLEG